MKQNCHNLKASFLPEVKQKRMIHSFTEKGCIVLVLSETLTDSRAQTEFNSISLPMSEVGDIDPTDDCFLLSCRLNTWLHVRERKLPFLFCVSKPLMLWVQKISNRTLYIWSVFLCVFWFFFFAMFLTSVWVPIVLLFNVNLLLSDNQQRVALTHKRWRLLVLRPK